jgi:hypothetical protein
MEGGGRECMGCRLVIFATKSFQCTRCDVRNAMLELVFLVRLEKLDAKSRHESG